MRNQLSAVSDANIAAVTQLLMPSHPHAHAALCFNGIGYFDIGLAIFTGRLGWLADRIVPCGPKQAARSREDWVALLQRRLQPVVRGAR